MRRARGKGLSSPVRPREQDRSQVDDDESGRARLGILPAGIFPAGRHMDVRGRAPSGQCHPDLKLGTEPRDAGSPCRSRAGRWDVSRPPQRAWAVAVAVAVAETSTALEMQISGHLPTGGGSSRTRASIPLRSPLIVLHVPATHDDQLISHRSMVGLDLAHLEWDLIGVSPVRVRDRQSVPSGSRAHATVSFTSVGSHATVVKSRAGLVPDDTTLISPEHVIGTQSSSMYRRYLDASAPRRLLAKHGRDGGGPVSFDAEDSREDGGSGWIGRGVFAASSPGSRHRSPAISRAAWRRSCAILWQGSVGSPGQGSPFSRQYLLTFPGRVAKEFWTRAARAAALGSWLGRVGNGSGTEAISRRRPTGHQDGESRTLDWLTCLGCGGTLVYEVSGATEASKQTAPHPSPPALTGDWKFAAPHRHRRPSATWKPIADASLDFLPLPGARKRGCCWGWGSGERHNQPSSREEGEASPREAGGGTRESDTSPGQGDERGSYAAGRSLTLFPEESDSRIRLENQTRESDSRLRLDWALGAQVSGHAPTHNRREEKLGI
ncbi:hypothetical protein JHW43_001832 [Diplocarpon mali]|nr:hypothetical protein JHW43_001832 [Diplocarpon mali]